MDELSDSFLPSPLAVTAGGPMRAGHAKMRENDACSAAMLSQLSGFSGEKPVAFSMLNLLSNEWSPHWDSCWWRQSSSAYGFWVRRDGVELARGVLAIRSNKFILRTSIALARCSCGRGDEEGQCDEIRACHALLATKFLSMSSANASQW